MTDMRAIHVTLSARDKSSVSADGVRVIEDGTRDSVFTVIDTNNREAVYKEWFDNHPKIKPRNYEKH